MTIAGIPPAPLAADQALQRLRDGNHRFVQNVRSMDTAIGQSARASLAARQTPFAVILSCSDSRVPSEIVFDQGLGDLFVIRVAGNVVAPSLVGSVEFAAATFGTRLVVVMGHTRCGAIKATLDFIQHSVGAPSENIHDIVDRCRPAVESVVSAAGPDVVQERLVQEAVRANVRQSCSHLRHASRMLERLIQEEGLLVVGAEYSLDTGKVDFFDAPQR
ncbi:Carbonic anhydrase [Cystobacter fuscus DSM 2262]|uniref:Carbonic anhydrase n=1 Tax=Cystobacter fuscus (strain ATCC 25194 / DSM 2262 / NBRC 100088 / M29) TaxID=1242864 RepID=S9R1P5_CYSF2|nr:carbonic anhydrase [Cystobacter fuscus]EPX62818.1 Carbonic anhydrase [Cystobacter fuscus DSM 2262]